MNREYEDWDLSELRDELSKRGLKATGTKDEMVGRLELDDAERELDGVATEPEPEPEPDPEPEPASASEAVSPDEPEATSAAPRWRPGLPPTHQVVNQDPATAYRLLPDGRRVPIV